MDYLLLKCKESIIAFSFEQILEINHLPLLQDVPYHGKGYIGMLNYRGTSLPVYDLSLVLYDSPTPITMTTKILIINPKKPYGIVFEDIVENVLDANLETREEEAIFKQMLVVKDKIYPFLDSEVLLEIINSEKEVRSPSFCINSKVLEKLLKKRSEKFLKDHEEQESATNYLLVFEVSNELYAISASLISEIIKADQIFRVPAAPGYIFGIISIRGNIITVFDLKYYQFGEKTEVTDRTKIIVVKYGDKKVSLVVDNVIDFVSLESKDKFSPHFLVSDKENFIVEQFKFGEKLVNILDVSGFFSKIYEEEGVV